jgi:hypothetical protein
MRTIAAASLVLSLTVSCNSTETPVSPTGTGGQAATGGSATGGAATGGTAVGGSTTGGTSSGGAGPAGGNPSGGKATGGSLASGGTTGTGGSTGTAGTSACSSTLSSRVRITETDIGVAYLYNEVDNNGAALGLTPLAISPVPGGGSRLSFLGSDNMVHVATLDANDQWVSGSTISLTGFDVQDIYADASGGVLLVSRTALGSPDNHNCGNINNLCGGGATSAFPTAASCYDMYMVRFDGSTETWATKLTDTTASLPAYGVSPTSGGNVIFIWSQYAHNGRIAFDGTNYAGYFGAAITVPNQGCTASDSILKNGVNIHQGDRMQVVGPTGTLLTGHNSFTWGCSHSGYERIVWDSTASKFVCVCKNDAATGGKSGRLAFAPNTTTIYPVDLSYSNLGNVMMAGGGGYWIISSDIRAGQTANANGLADIHLLHVASTSTPTPDNDIMLVSDGANDRAPHLVAYGTSQLVAAWEEASATGDLRQNATGRQMYVQILDKTTGTAPAGSTTNSAGPLSLSPNVLGSRYQDFRAYPDGSVAYPAPGSSNTKIKILRILPCAG